MKQSQRSRNPMKVAIPANQLFNCTNGWPSEVFVIGGGNIETEMTALNWFYDQCGQRVECSGISHDRPGLYGLKVVVNPDEAQMKLGASDGVLMQVSVQDRAVTVLAQHDIFVQGVELEDPRRFPRLNKLVPADRAIQVRHAYQMTSQGKKISGFIIRHAATVLGHAVPLRALAVNAPFYFVPREAVFG